MGRRFCCAWLLPRQGRVEVVSARLNPCYDTIDVGGVCNFLGFVSWQQKFEVTAGSVFQPQPHVISSDGPVSQPRVTAQFYLESKEENISRHEACRPRRCKEKRNPQPKFGSSFYMFFLLPLGLPYAN